MPLLGNIVKVQVALILYFGVMTMWLIELISATKFISGYWFQVLHNGDVRPPNSKRSKAWFSGELKV